MTGRPVLTNSQRIEIQRLRQETKLTIEQIAERFDVSVPTIKKAVKATVYKHQRAEDRP